jgi:hypothetical protein
VVDDEDIATGYRRQDLDKSAKLCPSDELSDYVRLRLALARALAMQAYEKAHAT